MELQHEYKYFLKNPLKIGNFYFALMVDEGHKSKNLDFVTYLNVKKFIEKGPLKIVLVLVFVANVMSCSTYWSLLV